MLHRLRNLIRSRSGSNSGVPVTWLASWNPIGERGNSSDPPGGRSLSQVIAPFSTLRSQISGIRNPEVMASTNGGQRLIVSSSRILTALKACVGIALSQPGTPSVAGIGGGISPSSSAGQRNFSVSGSLLSGTVFVLGWLAVPALSPPV